MTLSRPASTQPQMHSAEIASQISLKSRTDERVAALGQFQNLLDTHLDLDGVRIDRRALTGLALNGVEGVAAHVEAHALRHETVDQRSVFVRIPQQINARTECDDLERDLIRAIG